MAEQERLPIAQERDGTEGGDQRQRHTSRRTFIRTGLAVAAGVAASAYVKPSLQSIGIPRAFAAASGCTPGLWKNKTSLWPLAFDPSDDFDLVFDVTGLNRTLLKALQTGGGGLDALGRHATAALLNAAAGIYSLSVAQVKADTKAAVDSGDSGLIENTKTAFETLNEAVDCDLGGKADNPL